MSKRKSKSKKREVDADDKKREHASIPMPSTNPATNAIIAGLLIKGAGRVLLSELEKRMIVKAYDPDKARELIDGRTVVTSIALYGASKLAARSVPGLAIVAGGMLVKSLYDRGRSVQQAKRAEQARSKA